MKNTSIILCLAAAVAVAAGAPAMAATYSASGTHQCRTPDGEIHSCIVSGSVYSNCIDAESSLRAQDCCPSTSTRNCSRDAQGRDVKCGRGGVSAGFTMNYCIPGGP